MPRRGRGSRHNRGEGARADSEHAGGMGGSRGAGFVVDEDTLAELGVAGQYRTEAEKDGGARDHWIHLIAPHDDDGRLYGMKIYSHYSVGPDGASFLCPRWMKKCIELFNSEHMADIKMPEEIADGRCPICEHLDPMEEKWNKMRAGRWKEKYTPEEEQFAGELNDLRPWSNWKEKKPKSVLLWVRDASSEDAEEEGLKYYFAPSTKVYEAILKICRDRRTDEYIDPADPDNGYVLSFSREGTGLTTDYTNFEKEKRDPIPEDWDDVPRFLDILTFATYDEIAEAFGTPRGDDARTGEREKLEDELGDEMDRSKEESGRRRRRTRARPEPEEDDEPNPTDDGNGDEAPPRRRRRRTRSREEESADDNDISETRERVAAARKRRQRKVSGED